MANKSGHITQTEPEVSMEESIQRAEEHYFKTIRTERERRVTHLEKIASDEKEILM